MSNWWTQWAERIALVLAELWTRSRSEDAGERSAGGVGPGAAPADRPENANLSDAPPAPDANAPR